VESLIDEIEELDRTTHVAQYTVTFRGYDSVFVIDQTFDITVRTGTVGGVLRAFRKIRGHKKPPRIIIDQIIRGKTEIEHMGVSIAFNGDIDRKERLKFLMRMSSIPDEFVKIYAEASLHG